MFNLFCTLNDTIDNLFFRPEKMNKCIVIPGHVQIKIQQLTNTLESKNKIY